MVNRKPIDRGYLCLPDQGLNGMKGDEARIAEPQLAVGHTLLYHATQMSEPCSRSGGLCPCSRISFSRFRPVPFLPHVLTRGGHYEVPVLIATRRRLVTLIAILAAAIGCLWRLARPDSIAFAQLVDTSGQDFYANAKTIVEQPLPELIKALPELQGLEPQESQEGLSGILDRVGEKLEVMYQNLQNTCSDEEVTQEQLRRDGRRLKRRRQQFSYLILAHQNSSHVTLDEYRTDSKGVQIELYGVEEGFSVTTGFASGWMHFHLSNRSASRFRYVGRQVLDGHRAYVIAFAQRPGWATKTGRAVSTLGAAVLLWQGLAWIDTTSYQIIRMRLDLLAPRTDIKLERQTTEVRFEEVRLPRASSPQLLPKEVVVISDYDGNILRNQHHYSNYRLFGADITIKPIKQDQQPSKNPD